MHLLNTCEVEPELFLLIRLTQHTDTVTVNSEKLVNCIYLRDEWRLSEQ